MEKRKLRGGSGEPLASKRQERGRERDARKITIFPSLSPAIVLLANLCRAKSQQQRGGSASPPPSLELESFPSLLLLFSQLMKTITLCWFPSCVTIYRFPLDGFFPFRVILFHSFGVSPILLFVLIESRRIPFFFSNSNVLWLNAFRRQQKTRNG